MPLRLRWSIYRTWEYNEPMNEPLVVEKLRIGNELISCEYDIRERNVVILHGAGASGKDRYYGFAERIRERGLGVIIFDFSGHGESSGTIRRSSLETRTFEAKGVIDKLLPKPSTFYLVGFSMGAQAVCDLLSEFGQRVPSILLGCPGIYDKKAVRLLFEDPEFTKLLRGEKSWSRSGALENLQSYKGKTVIAIGDEDNVIPEGVISLLLENAQNPRLHRYKGVDHQLAKWLSQNQAELETLLNEMF